VGALAGQVQEGIGALKTLQAFGAGPAELNRFEGRAASLQDSLGRAAWARAGVPAMMELLAAVAIASVLAFALTTQQVAPEALLSFLAAVVLLYQPAKDLGRMTPFAAAAAAALERIDAVLQLPTAAPRGTGIATAKQSVRVEGLAFSWGDRPALEGVDLEVKAGQVTAVVGASGGGKSTLTALLLGFEAPRAGRILFDGVDAAQCTLQSVRAQFALVTQEPLLFAGTVAENLRVARPEATDGELEAMARLADAHAFISALPKGYQTPLGERGVSLSGGQRQRLCLARALLCGAPVLVLDEATSSVDPASEAELQRALDGAVIGRTALVIAHRLSAVTRADRIHVLEQGRVVESGSHAELLALRGRYAAMWAQQGT
jgi:subfamily B ATP-binding cassette protein MsbA